MFNSRSNVDLGLLLIRIAVGVIFISHGWDKLMNIEGTAGFFVSLGIPMAEVFAWVVALVELLGGLALVLGLGVQLVGLLLAGVMLVAICSAKWPAGATFMESFGKSEYEIVLLFCNLAFLFAGAGKYALGGKKNLDQGNMAIPRQM